MSYGLTEDYINLLNAIFKQNSFIEKVVIYGSRAKGNFTERSDIDFVIYGNLEDRFQISKIKNEIEESSIPYKTDIQMFDDIKNVSLIDHIDRVGKVFYKRS